MTEHPDLGRAHAMHPWSLRQHDFEPESQSSESYFGGNFCKPRGVNRFALLVSLAKQPTCTPQLPSKEQSPQLPTQMAEPALIPFSQNMGNIYPPWRGIAAQSSHVGKAGPPVVSSACRRQLPGIQRMTCLMAFLLTHFIVAAVPVVPLAASQVQLAPHMQVYDPPLPPGTRTDDITWASYLAPAPPLHAVEGLPISAGVDVRAMSANMSWQQAGLLRLDVVVRGARLVGGEGLVVTAFNWTSPGSMTLDDGTSVTVPRVSLTPTGAGSVVCALPDGGGGSCGVATYCANATVCNSFTSSAPSWLAPLGGLDALLVAHVAVPGGAGAGPAVAVGVLGGEQRAQVSAGVGHSCAVVSDGSAWCWGRGDYGQLGTGTIGDVLSPVRVNGSSWGSGHGQVAATAISAGENHTCAVVSDGLAWCWGRGDYGQLGTGTIGDVLSPVRVNGSSWGSGPDTVAVTAISTGWRHTCAVTSDGSAWCWGRGSSGQLGTGTIGDVLSPVRVNGSLIMTTISAGRDHTCAVVSDGSAWCWGLGGSGRLGIGPTGSVSSPARVNATSWGSGHGQVAVTAISAGAAHTCAVVSDGSAWCWGGARHGQQGTGSNRSVSLPARVNGSAWGSGHGQVAVTAISAGTAHTCAVVSDGSAWCWGWGVYGQLGIGPSGDVLSPVRVNATSWGSGHGQVAVTAISAGQDHTCAVVSDDTTWCWGRGRSGQLGRGSTGTAPVPVRTDSKHATDGCYMPVSNSHTTRGLVLGALVFSAGPLECTPPAQPTWRQLASVHAGLGDDHWLRDPPLRHALPPWAALADATPGMHVALGSVRQCSAGGGAITWEMQDTVLSAPWGSLVSLGGSAAAASALPPAACSG